MLMQTNANAHNTHVWFLQAACASAVSELISA